MAEAKLNLAAKIAKISSEIGAIDKTGTNMQQRYKFIEYAVVAAEIREKQSEIGVAIVPQVESYTCDQITTSKGGMGFHYLLNMTFDVINTDDANDKIQVKWIGEATDYGDKGVNKAITSAVKYFIMRLYNISEKGDKEADESTPEMATGVVATQYAQRAKEAVDNYAKKLDFNTIKATLDEIDDVESLEEYWRSLGNLSDKQAAFLQKLFAKRKEVINGMV